ncbi:MAG TPA: carboxypeptidase regulatory-like domain-containing protein [Bryobacteraceae bacterium]|nr:carboxypeptidase regulatory-like domain-containing protein [Bryobacteraceae bacterium]
MIPKNIVLAVCAVLLLTLTAAPLGAQSSGTAALTGTLTDPSGARLPNVTVTATNTATGQERTITTGGDGTYRFTLLPPGTYRVRFAAAGFKTEEVSSVTLNVAETPVLDRSLEVGTQTEQVVVEANAEVLQTADSTLGRVIDSNTLTNQPLATRNFTSIMGLEAGATGAVGNATVLGKGTADVAVNGGGLDQNNIQMDGATIVNGFGAGNNADSGIYVGVAIPNPDAIQEFKIQTSTYDASYGRNPGANVNIVTRSGTNALHGSLFEFLRNSDLNANSFFYNRDNPASQTTKQVLKQNQFGGTIGGAIKKNKLFFFGSYQGTRQRNGYTGSASPVLPPIPAGDRSAPGFRAALGAAMCPANHPGNPAYLTGLGIIPTATQVACDGSNINPVALNILNVKLPNGAYYVPGSTTGGFQQAQYSFPAIYTGDQYLANVDYLINSKNTLAMRYFFTEDPQTVPFGIANVPGTPSSSYYANTISRAKLTTLITPTLINQAQASLERNIANGHDSTPYTNQQVGITGIVPQETLPPVMIIVGAMTIGGTLAPFSGPANQMQYSDQISWSHGKHTIRAGYELEFLQWNLSFASLLRGFLISPGFNDFLVGLPGGFGPGTMNDPVFGSWISCLFCVRSGPNGIIHGYREHNQSFYVQDDWKVNQHLTVNAGIRWEYDGVFGDHYGNLTNVWPSLMAGVTPPTSSQPSGAGLIGYVVPSNFTNHYPAPPAGVTTLSSQFPSQNGVPLNDFGPRLGFAYQPKAGGKLVVRGGFGIFYDRVGSSKFVHAVEQGVPYALTLDFSGGAALPHSLANPFPSTPLGFVPRWYDPTTGANSALNTPYYERVHAPLSRQFNLGVQYQFASRWLLEVGYVGSSGINQANYNHNVNLAQLATPSNPFNGLTTTTLANAAGRVPYVGYQEAGLQATAYDAIYNYNSLQVTVRKQMSHGFTFQGAYTWSKDLTNLSGDGQTNINNADLPGTQYAPAYFSHPHRFVASYGYDLPFGNPKGALNKLVTGWNVSGNMLAQTGTPLTITDTSAGTAYYGAANAGTAEGGTVTAQLAQGITNAQIPTSGGVESRLGGNSGGPGYLNTKAFVNPIAISADGATLFGNSGIGILRGPDQVNFDVSLIKNTRITERQNVQLRAEFFNIANHPVFGNPTTARNNAALFGVINSEIGNPRLVQFALKYSF